jgi:hypothetical protein
LKYGQQKSKEVGVVVALANGWRAKRAIQVSLVMQLSPSLGKIRFRAKPRVGCMFSQLYLSFSEGPLMIFLRERSWKSRAFGAALSWNSAMLLFNHLVIARSRHAPGPTFAATIQQSFDGPFGAPTEEARLRHSAARCLAVKDRKSNLAQKSCIQCSIENRIVPCSAISIA